ncbi:hypothetical protein BKA63DRAFT_567359 [Paraphoma chrysanthemicola]|nr:hypothetical protein BKA63DRAFT_567359 [Paraphoma chrysanthemicola]
MSDASRRQILVKNLNPDVVRTLAETAACHQVDALRDTISKHISGETSIKVQRQVDGEDKPRLELHLPYLTLRRLPLAKSKATCATIGQSRKPRTSFYVPEFAALDGEQSHRYVIHESHVSLALCAWDHTKWTVYAFFKPCPEAEPEDEHKNDVASDDGEEDDSDNEGENDDDDLFPTEDILAPDNGAYNLNADQTIWDPRKYFIRIAAIWVALVLREYTYLVQTLDANVKAWRIAARNSASEGLCSSKQDRFAAKDLLASSQAMKQLLREVREHMMPAIRAWDLFKDIDLPFFADLQDRDAKFATSDMRSSFGKLVDLEQKLGFLDQYFVEIAKDLKLQLILESNDLNHHAHELNLKRTLISHDIHELNRTSTEAALANMRAAEKTSSTTQVNVLLIWVTTPIILVLQYFGAERPIFAFERNTRSFVLALLVVFAALPLLIFLLGLVEHLKQIVLSTRGMKKTKRTRTSNSIGVSGMQLQSISHVVP